MEVAGVAIGHSPHAKDHLGLEPGCGGTQSWSKPVELQIKWLERAVIQVLAEVGQRFFQLVLETASGRKTKSEAFGYGEDEFAPWVLGATM